MYSIFQSVNNFEEYLADLFQPIRAWRSPICRVEYFKGLAGFQILLRIRL
jgi:hypothetical protein